MSIASTVDRALCRLGTAAVPCVRPRIERVVPHDAAAYTQGLCFAGERLYESTGTWTDSTLRRIDPETGSVLEKVAVAHDFAEDITCVDGRMFQLTWKSGRMLEYALDPLGLVGEAKYEGEGWGLARHGDELLVTDGTSAVRRYDLDMKRRGVCRVRSGWLPFRHLNAMEVVGGFAYANVWYTTLVVQIEIGSMRVVRTIDCSELALIEAPANPHHILNGIAHAPARSSFFLTGKHWRRMFEVSIP